MSTVFSKNKSRQGSGEISAKAKHAKGKERKRKKEKSVPYDLGFGSIHWARDERDSLLGGWGVSKYGEKLLW